MYEIIKNLLYMYRRSWLASTLNIIGLTLALLTFFCFWSRLQNTLTRDTCFDDFRSIYRLEVESNILDEDTVSRAVMPVALVPQLERLPHVSAVGVLDAHTSEATAVAGTKKIPALYVENFGNRLSFWKKDIFLVSVDSLADKPNAVAVPKSIAVSLFGTYDVGGKELSVRTSSCTQRSVIAKVYDDLPEDCSLPNAICNCADADMSETDNFRYLIYLRIPNAADIPQLQKMIDIIFLRTVAPAYSENRTVYARSHLQPLQSAYFSGTDETSDRGSYILVVIIFMASQLVLALAYINFANLSMATAPVRVKGVNTRRIIGATTLRLRVMMVAESVVLALCAFAFSMALAYIIDKAWHIGVSPARHTYIVAYTFAAALVIGLFTSIRPMLFATSVRPTLALKGLPPISGKARRLRMIRIAFQIVTSFVIVGFIVSLCFFWLHVYQGDGRYENDSVLTAALGTEQAVEKSAEVVGRIRDIDGVKSVSLSRFRLGDQDRYMQWSLQSLSDDRSMLVRVLPIDHDFLSTMGIKVIQGRDFLPSDTLAYIVSSDVMKKHPWVKPGQPLLDGDKETGVYEVVGVCENLRIGSLRLNNTEVPFVFFLSENHADTVMGLSCMPVLNIRLADDSPRAADDVMRDITDAYNSVVADDACFRLQHLYSGYARLYSNELRFMAEVSLIGLAYLIVTLIGVFCHTLYEHEARRREIAVRRVFGATSSQIVLMSVRRYVWLLLASFCVSLPLIFFLSDFALSEYKEQPSHLWLSYLISLVVVSALTLLTVAAESCIYAKTRPVNLMRND